MFVVVVVYSFSLVNSTYLAFLIFFPDSSPVVSKLSLLINYLLGKRLGYARGEDGKPSSPLLKSLF